MVCVVPLLTSRSVMIGLGAIFVGNFLNGATCLLSSSVWHLALAGFLSYLLQTDLHVALGIDGNHLMIGAAVHLVLGAIYVYCGTVCCGSSCSAKSEKDKKKK